MSENVNPNVEPKETPKAIEPEIQEGAGRKGLKKIIGFIVGGIILIGSAIFGVSKLIKSSDEETTDDSDSNESAE